MRDPNCLGGAGGIRWSLGLMSVGANKRVTPDTSPLEDAGGLEGRVNPPVIIARGDIHG